MCGIGLNRIVAIEKNSMISPIVADNHIQYIGCGVAIYMTVLAEQTVSIYQNHIIFHPTELTAQTWGDLAFEVKTGGYQFTLAAVQG